MRRLAGCTLAAFLALFGSEVLAQTPLGGEFRVNTYTTGYQYGGAVAPLAGGGFVVVWYGPVSGSGTDVFGQRYANTGATVGGEFVVNASTTGNQTTPAVAMLPSGFVVTWTDQLGDPSSAIFGRRFDAAGAPLGAEFRVNTYTTGNQDQPAVAADATGAFVVVWESLLQDQASEGIFGQLFGSAGAPAGAEFRVNAYTTGGQQSPAVASASTGGFVVTWADTGQDGSGSGIVGRRYDGAGVALSGEFPVNTYTTLSQLRPRVAVAPGGAFVVVWWGQGPGDGSSTGVFARRFASGGAALDVAEFRANTYTTGIQLAADVAVDSNGDFVVAWPSNYQYDVFAQRFSSNGASLGTEFRVNSYTTSVQAYPSIAFESPGNFVVVWSTDDGGNTGIAGQRYGSVVPVELMGFTAD